MIKNIIRYFYIFLTCLNCFAATHYIAASGLDTNNGTTTSTPWLHAPGMPNCANNCGSYTPVAGDRIIFKGGDIWHFGNSAASPYVGAASGGVKWNIGYTGSAANCDPSDTVGAVRSSCIYIGVDQTFFTGASWTRPIMTGDNAVCYLAVVGGNCNTGTSGTAPGAFFVTTCSFPTNYTFFSTNNGAEYIWMDNFEWTGMCQGSGGPQVSYIDETSGALKWNIYSNNYGHGITHVAYSCGATCFNTFMFTVRIGTQSTIGPGNVCDGWDSDPNAVGCDIFGGYLIYDNVFGNYSQIVINGCHDNHDNLIYNFNPTGDGVSHGNAWECNSPDAPDSDNNGDFQPNIPINVYYNNVHMHDASGNSTTGDVKIWLCPVGNVTEYWFGNVIYDVGTGQIWNAQGGACNASPAVSWKFNNTIDMAVDNPSTGPWMDCPAQMTSAGNLIISDTTDGYGNPGSGCPRSDVVITHAQAITQGYMANGTGQTGNNSNKTCANDNTPCAPTSITNASIGTGVNEQTLCTNMLSSTQTMIQNAGTACKNSTSDGCSYITSTRSVSCPKNVPKLRPVSLAWDAGADQFTGSSNSAIFSGVMNNGLVIINGFVIH